MEVRLLRRDAGDNEGALLFLEVGQLSGWRLELVEAQLGRDRLTRTGKQAHDTFQTPRRLLRLSLPQPGVGQGQIQVAQPVAQVFAGRL